MFRHKKFTGKIILAVLCLGLLLTAGQLTVSAQDADVDAVTAMLQEIDSLQEMQNKRGTDFKITGGNYNPDDPATVQEHEAMQDGYKAYVAEMNAKRAAAQAAYDALSEEQKAQLDPELVKKLTDELETSFSNRSFRLVPSNDEYNYQMVQISANRWLAYELSMHATEDKDMPCTLILADTSGDATSIVLDGPYSYGTNNYELTYCCDERQPTTYLAHYKRINLEDCTYYNSYQASKIRAIILNSYPFVPLEEMIVNLKEAGLSCAEELDRADITAAVQFAVWFYSNRMTNGMLSADTTYGSTANAIDYPRPSTRLIDSVHDYRNELWYWWNTNNYYDWAYDESAYERVTELFDYLTSLPGVAASGNQFVISDIKITRANMVEGSDNTYTIGLNILLNHGAAEGDQVTLKISTSEGFPEENTQLIDVTGQTSYAIDVTAAYGDTVYVAAEGTQYLEKNAYFYDPKGGYDASQALVGVAEGDTRVKAANSFLFEKDIDAGIRIYKTEEETGNPLPGIVFKAYTVPADDAASLGDKPTDEEIARYAVEENLAGTLTTDSTGYAALELDRGTYLLVEEPSELVKAPVSPMYVTLPCADSTSDPDIAELHLQNKAADEGGTISVDLSATKKFDHWDKADSFRFELKAVSENAPMPEETVAVATEDEPKALFDSIVFFEPGTYEYTITEINDGLDGITYDVASHKVVIEVTEEMIPSEEDGGYLLDSYRLLADVSYDGEETLTITNTYTDDAGDGGSGDGGDGGSGDGSATPAKTGDASDAAFWVLAALLAAFVLAIAAMLGWRRER